MKECNRECGRGKSYAAHFFMQDFLILCMTSVILHPISKFNFAFYLLYWMLHINGLVVVGTTITICTQGLNRLKFQFKIESDQLQICMPELGFKRDICWQVSQHSKNYISRWTWIKLRIYCICFKLK